MITLRDSDGQPVDLITGYESSDLINYANTFDLILGDIMNTHNGWNAWINVRGVSVRRLLMPVDDTELAYMIAEMIDDAMSKAGIWVNFDHFRLWMNDEL